MKLPANILRLALAITAGFAAALPHGSADVTPGLDVGEVEMLLRRQESLAQVLAGVWAVSGTQDVSVASATAAHIYSPHIEEARRQLLVAPEHSLPSTAQVPTQPADGPLVAAGTEDDSHLPEWDPRSRPQPKFDTSVRNSRRPASHDYEEEDPGPDVALAAADYDIMLSQMFGSEAFASDALPSVSGVVLRAGAIFCPVAGPEPPNFIDSWGYPRSGGRRHKGQDLFAPVGTPLVAVRDGVVTKVDPVDNYRVGSGRGDLGGITIWLVDVQGDSWYYAHLSGIAPGITDNTPVRAGQLLGYVGNTGNAATTPPHLHIGWYPNGGEAANPYSMLASACAADAPNRIVTPEDTGTSEPVDSSSSADSDGASASDAADAGHAAATSTTAP